MRRAFEGHGAAAIDVRRLDRLRLEAQGLENVEAGFLELLAREAEGFGAERLAQCPFVDDEADVESLGEPALDRFERRRSEALRGQRGMVDAGRVLQRAVAHRVKDDLFDLGRAVAEHGQGFRHMRLMILK